MSLLQKIRGFLRYDEPEAPPAPEAPVPLKKTCKQCGKTFTVDPAWGFVPTFCKDCKQQLAKDKELAHFVTGPMELEGKTEKTYDLPCTIFLAEGASLLDILIVASQRNLNGLKADVDIQAALKKNGVLRAPFRFRDLDLKELTER